MFVLQVWDIFLFYRLRDPFGGHLWGYLLAFGFSLLAFGLIFLPWMISSWHWLFASKEHETEQ